MRSNIYGITKIFLHLSYSENNIDLIDEGHSARYWGFTEGADLKYE